MQKIKCRIAEVSLKSKDTIFIDIEADQLFNIDDYREVSEAAEILGNGNRMYNIINVGENTIPTKEAREKSCSLKGSIYKWADAFVILSLSQKIIANLMLKLNKPVVPTKFFNSLEEAEKWILDLRVKNVFAY